MGQISSKAISKDETGLGTEVERRAALNKSIGDYTKTACWRLKLVRGLPGNNEGYVT